LPKEDAAIDYMPVPFAGNELAAATARHSQSTLQDRNVGLLLQPQGTKPSPAQHWGKSNGSRNVRNGVGT
jgi:hypothetical protein